MHVLGFADPPVHTAQRKIFFSELVQKKILPRATYEGIKYKIVAKQK